MKIKIAFVVLLAVLSCTKPDAIRNTADQFMDAYYVKADLEAALKICDGVACEKIQASQKLREGQSIDASTHHPNIRFKLLSARATENEASYFYSLTIKPKEAEPLYKKTYLKLRKRDESSWKVTQFSDQDLPGLPSLKDEPSSTEVSK